MRVEFKVLYMLRNFEERKCILCKIVQEKIEDFNELNENTEIIDIPVILESILRIKWMNIKSKK